MKTLHDFYEGGKDFVPGLSASYLINYFQDLVVENKLKIFSVDKKTIEKKLIKIKKKTGLLEEHQDYIIKDSKARTRYVLKINNKEGIIALGDSSLTRYYECILEKLADDFNVKQIKEYKDTAKSMGLDIPEEAVVANLKLNYEEDDTGSWIRYWSLHLVMEGKQDKLFMQISEDIKKKVEKNK